MRLHLLPTMMTSLCLSAVGLAQTPALAQVRPTHIERFRSPRAKAESAEREAEASLASDPANVEALNARALARARLGRLQQAYDDLQRAAVLNPTRAETQANLGYILWNLGRKTEARRAEQAAIGLDNNNLTAHHQLGRFLLLGGSPNDLDESVAHLRRALEIDRHRSDIRFDLVTAHRALGQNSEAMRQVLLLQESRPSDARVIYAAALLASDRGDLPAAIQGFREAGTRDKALAPRAYRDLGLACMKLKAQRSSPDGTHLRAIAFCNTGHMEEAETLQSDMEAIAERSENPAPDSQEDIGEEPTLLLKRANALARSGELEHAERLFRRVNELMPHTFEVLCNFGVTLQRLKREDEAATLLAEAADLNPAPAHTHLRLGLIASANSDHLNAIEEFRHAIERDPAQADSHYMLGREYFRFGFWEGALSEYGRAMTLDPRRPEYTLARAHAHLRNDDPAAAAADFETAAALDPHAGNIDYLTGSALVAAKQFDHARQYLERAVAKRADHAGALYALGSIALQENRLEDALHLFEQVLALAPGDTAALYGYAQVAVKQHNYIEAVARLERLAANSPDHLEGRYQLFLAYSRLGDKEKAQAALSKLERLRSAREQLLQEMDLQRKLHAQQMVGDAR